MVFIYVNSQNGVIFWIDKKHVGTGWETEIKKMLIFLFKNQFSAIFEIKLLKFPALR